MSATLGLPLTELLKDLISDARRASLPALFIHDLQLDSRQCRAGTAFVAIPGLTTHGLRFVSAAVQAGAMAVLWQPDDSTDAQALLAGLAPNIAVIEVANLKQHLSLLAHRLYGSAQALRIAAVTGTNGKSTTAYLLAQAAECCGMPAGYIGTVGCGRVTQLQTTTHTTADVLSVYRQLRDLQRQGARVVAMEVSSHALHQGRIAGLMIDTAVFTNLTQDHLDYHGTMQAYGAAKAILFEWPTLQHRVINADDAFGAELLRIPSQAHSLTYSCADGTVASHADVHARVRLHEAGLELAVQFADAHAVLQSPLLGRFNAENLLAALGVLLGWQVSLPDAVAALAQCKAPPGRMELWTTPNKRAVVDYAHTPDALLKALQVLKAHTKGRLIVVFGCGGDRDTSKRPTMGRIAEQFADVVVLTDDNPRQEDPARIRDDIRRGMQRDCVMEPDRARAIAWAFAQAQREDLVLIAGKGHEDYQIIGNETRHFSDREVVSELMRAAA